MLRRCIVFIVFLSHLCNGYKLLVVFPVATKSHVMLGDAIVRHLVNAGHEVTYITPVVSRELSPNLTIIDVSSNFKIINFDDSFNITSFLTKQIDLTDKAMIRNIMFDLAKASALHENVQKMLLDPKVEFDVVIAEWMYNEVYSGFHHVFGCPLIWSSSMEPHASVLRLIDEEVNPAYTAGHISTADPPFTFLQRVYELWEVLRIRYVVWSKSNDNNEVYQAAFSAAAAKRGRHLPPLEEAMYSASMMLGNSYVASGQPLRLPQNYKAISGYHINSKTIPLPEDLQIIMDNAKNGVIYFSMGSVLKSATWPPEIKRALLDMFKDLKQTVIWKFEEEMAGLPKNVHVVKWAPQQSILAHPNCILFITHGGLLSTSETLTFGVPVIGVPVFADQYINTVRAVNKGYGLKVDLNYDIVKNLKAAIAEILGNPRYTQRVKELSFVYKHRPASPAQELVHWVEHVVATGGAHHLRSPALQLPFYQKLYLDLLAVILLIVLSIVYVTKKLFLRRGYDKLKKNS